MSQHDLDIANQTASLAREDINGALKALGSTSSGPDAPLTTYENMLWYDTGSNTLKMRTEADDQWISIGYFDQSTDTFKILDDTVVTTADGDDTDGIIGDQTTATWEAGTGTTESLVSPAKVKAAIDENNFVTQTTGSAPFYAARAWGTVRSGALQGGQNFASYDQTTAVVTFTTAMPNATFSVVLQGQSRGATYAYNRTTTGFEVEMWSSGGNAISKSAFNFDFAVFA